LSALLNLEFSLVRKSKCIFSKHCKVNEIPVTTWDNMLWLIHIIHILKSGSSPGESFCFMGVGWEVGLGNVNALMHIGEFIKPYTFLGLDMGSK
jgi:hypothetical protein